MTETEELAAVLAALAKRMQYVVDDYTGCFTSEQLKDAGALNDALALLERLGYK